MSVHEPIEVEDVVYVEGALLEEFRNSLSAASRRTMDAIMRYALTQTNMIVLNSSGLHYMQVWGRSEIPNKNTFNASITDLVDRGFLINSNRVDHEYFVSLDYAIKGSAVLVQGCWDRIVMDEV